MAFLTRRNRLARLLPLLLLAGACSFPEYAFIAPPAPVGVCSDGLQGPKETGIDCGGLCPACGAGQGCLVGADCDSQHCEENICQTPNCSDGVENGAESDVDCGGSCGPCESGKRCNTAVNCRSGVCQGGSCQAPSCVDHITNGNESGIDCGGSCSACAAGMGCQLDTDCSSSSCDKTQHVCVDPGCLDKIKNGTETDVDCGGLKCAPCAPKLACLKPSDCDSSICDAVSRRCVAATCTDSVLNQGETDIDCGGNKCGGCGTNHTCLAASDCTSGVCQTKTCVPTQATNQPLPTKGWSATASATFSSSSTDQVFDGNVSTRWTSGAVQVPGMWFTLDLGTVQIFYTVKVDSSSFAGDGGKQFQVYYSTDQNFSTQPHGPYSGSATIASDTAIVARYIKFELLTDADVWWSIDEINVLQ